MLVSPLLRMLMKQGTLCVVDARGKRHTFAGAPGPSVTIRLHDRSLHWRLLWNPRLVVGEAYMDGTLTLEDDATIRDFLALVGANIHLLDEKGVIRLSNWLTPLGPPAAAAQPDRPRPAERGPHTTISPTTSTTSSSTRTGSIPAPISTPPTTRWNRRSTPRRGISPQSSCSTGRASACSTSARAGAGSASTCTSNPALP